MSNKSPKKKVGQPEEPLSDDMRRLRFIQNAKRPKCKCGETMRIFLLDFSKKTNDEIDAMTEEEYAIHLRENVPIVPCWSCDKCKAETDIKGLDWPEFDYQEEVRREENNKINDTKEQAKKIHCPYCGGGFIIDLSTAETKAQSAKRSPVMTMR